MNLINQARMLVMAATLGASVLGMSALHVEAQYPDHSTQQSCQAAGYVWSNTQGCADQYCNDALLSYGEPGETQSWGNHVYMCDGFSGTWFQIDLRVPPTHYEPPVSILTPTSLPVIANIGS